MLIVLSFLEFEVAVDYFVPRETAFGYFFEEWVWVEFFYVEYASASPLASEEHISTCHSRNTCCVANALRASFAISLLVRAVVVDIVSARFAVFDTTDAATDRCVASVVFAKFFRCREHSFEELERDDFLTVVVDFVDTSHTDVLDYAEVSEVFLSECHPETSTFDSWEVFNERLQLFVIEEV